MTMTRAEKKADRKAEKRAREDVRTDASASKKAEEKDRKLAERAAAIARKQLGVETEPTTTQSDPDQRGDKPRVRRLFKRFKGGRKTYVTGLILLAFEAATAVIALYPIAFLIDFLTGSKPTLREFGGPQILQSERFETILALAVAVLLIAATNSAARSLSEICMGRSGRSLGYRIRAAMNERLQHLPLGYHDSKRTGEILTRITRDVLVVEEFVVKSVRTIVGSLLVLVGSFAFVLFLSWPLAVGALLVAPPLAIASRIYTRRVKIASETRRRSEAELDSTTRDILRTARLMQSQGGGTVDFSRFSDQAAKSMRASASASRIQAWFRFVTALVEALAISAVVALGVWLVDRDEVTIGTLVLVILLLRNMVKQATKIISERNELGKVHDSIERIDDLLDRQVTVAQLAYAVEAPALEGHLKFRNVAFTYPPDPADGTLDTNRPALLEDIDFEVAPGEVVSLAGPSGAGKSTVAQLVLRLYDPDAGEVLIDGMPIRSMTVSSLRKQVNLVQEDVVVLAGSVADNIAYGIEKATQEDVEAAARLANAHEFIVNLPDGYQTDLGQRGSTLTGGQRQLIAIARAFMRRAPILILDEPTTGLDAGSARIVVDALATLMRGKTTIVISNDPALTQHSDRVLVIADGRIAELQPAPKGTVPTVGDPAPVVTATPKRRAKANPQTPTKNTPSETPAGSETRDRSHAPLLDSLHRHLPGLAKALDPSFVAEQIDQQLVGPDSTVASVDVGRVWLRDEGTCSLDYRVRLTNAAGDSSEHTVLGRVMPSDEDASEYMRHRVQPLEQRSSVLGPWREPSAVAPGSGLALHPFPIDPALPTLIPAMDPSVVLNLVEPAGLDKLPVAEPVHHPQEGACVLRYRFAGDDHWSTGVDLFGKVYGDDRGDAIAGNLKALTLGPDGQDLAAPLRFPRPIVYSASLRLLITEALPGEALVPALLESNLTGVQPHSRKGREARSETLRDAVRASAEALAVLHHSVAPASVHSTHDDLADLRRDLDVVGRSWPDVADDLRGRIDKLSWNAPEVPSPVLSHGGFTPSQVLIEGDTAAIVDLDTLCWADPALDVGCFLAHLDVTATTLGGADARALVDDLSQTFVDGYSRAAQGPSTEADRIGFFRALALTRIAVNACRQADDQRLDVALSLLDTLDQRHLGAE